MQLTHTFDGELLHGSSGASGGPVRNDKVDRKKADRELLASKLSPDLLTLYQCSQKHATKATGQTCKLPPSGTVEIQIQLTAGSAELDQKLTAAGLKIKSGGGTAVVSGEIAISKLKSLVEIAEVTSVIKLEQQAHLLRPR
jgi:hypothetical protein